MLRVALNSQKTPKAAAAGRLAAANVSPARATTSGKGASLYYQAIHSQQIMDKFVEQILRSAKWCNENGIVSEFDKGMEMMTTENLTESQQTVALCLTTKNRLWQLQRALPLTLLHAWPHRAWVCVHLVICDCAEGAMEWVIENCQPAMEAGLLQVYNTDGNMKYWHASIAKNTSHMVAHADILVNVDGDNIIGSDFLVNVINNFKDGYKVLQYEQGEGTTGRIACLREDFIAIGGYDENAYPMGGQDTDLVRRLVAWYTGHLVYTKLERAHCLRHGQLVYKRVTTAECLTQAIPNTVKAKICCIDPRYKGLRWGQMNVKNLELFSKRLIHL